MVEPDHQHIGINNSLVTTFGVSWDKFTLSGGLLHRRLYSPELGIPPPAADDSRRQDEAKGGAPEGSSLDIAPGGFAAAKSALAFA
jgi:hypothetical protein